MKYALVVIFMAFLCPSTFATFEELMEIQQADPGKRYPEKVKMFNKLITDSISGTSFADKWEPIKKHLDEASDRIMAGGSGAWNNEFHIALEVIENFFIKVKSADEPLFNRLKQNIRQKSDYYYN